MTLPDTGDIVADLQAQLEIVNEFMTGPVAGPTPDSSPNHNTTSDSPTPWRTDSSGLGEKWEVYTVLADAEVFGTSPEHFAADPAGGCSCTECDNATQASDYKVPAGSSCC